MTIPATTPADGENTLAAWWAALVDAAAALDDAANCMRDPDAERAARGAAQYARKRGKELWNARATPSSGKAEAEQWIPISERLPEIDTYVIVRYSGNNWRDSSDQANVNCVVMKRIHAEIEGSNKTCYQWKQFGPLKLFGQEVTHWSPLPAAPRERDKQ
jgi:hypothetical protein